MPNEVATYFLDHVCDWNFDIFHVEKLTNSQSLRYTTYALCQKCELPKRHEVSGRYSNGPIVLVYEFYSESITLHIMVCVMADVATDMHTHARTRMHTHTHYAYTHYTHTHAHTHTTHTPTYTHTHIHTHSTLELKWIMNLLLVLTAQGYPTNCNIIIFLFTHIHIL